ncbi:MAG: hypothetical protein Q9227_000115 [Pyrenula ochraceoflavens]
MQASVSIFLLLGVYRVWSSSIPRSAEQLKASSSEVSHNVPTRHAASDASGKGLQRRGDDIDLEDDDLWEREEANSDIDDLLKRSVNVDIAKRAYDWTGIDLKTWEPSEDCMCDSGAWVSCGSTDSQVNQEPLREPSEVAIMTRVLRKIGLYPAVEGGASPDDEK